MRNVVIILPTYNEVANIKPLIERLRQTFPNLIKYNFSILVVDDNSPDGTTEVVERLQKKYKNIHLLTGPKKGLGVAYVRGMKYAVEKLNADIFFEMDADFSHNSDLIPLFLSAIEAGADFVVGSRYIPEGSIPQDWAFYRKLFSIAGNVVVRFGLVIPKIRDWSSGYRAIRSEVFKNVHAGLEKYSGYTFQIALLHRAIQKGYNVVEVPLQFIDRKHGGSKFESVDFITNVLLYIFFNSTFIRFCIVGSIGFIINVLGLEIFYGLGLRPGPAAALGAEFAIVSNFLLNNFWSFSYNKIVDNHLFKKFFQFNTVSAGAIFIQWIIVGLGTSIFGDQTRLICLIFAIVIFVIPYSYFMYNRFIWKSN